MAVIRELVIGNGELGIGNWEQGEIFIIQNPKSKIQN
jgi:hypothetical protein